MIWLAAAAVSGALGWLLGSGDQAANLRAAHASAPLWGALLFLGATLGGYGRERVRRRLSYASPTRAWLGKAMAFSGLLPLGTFASSPVAWDPACLPWAAGAAAAGIAAWLANLPRRL